MYFIAAQMKGMAKINTVVGCSFLACKKLPRFYEKLEHFTCLNDVSLMGSGFAKKWDYFSGYVLITVHSYPLGC